MGVGSDCGDRACCGLGADVNLTRKLLEVIRVALDEFIESGEEETRVIETPTHRITLADAKDARAWVGERIVKLDSGTWY